MKKSRRRTNQPAHSKVLHWEGKFHAYIHLVWPRFEKVRFSTTYHQTSNSAKRSHKSLCAVHSNRQVRWMQQIASDRNTFSFSLRGFLRAIAPSRSLQTSALAK
jgi:hypothetical protein